MLDLYTVFYTNTWAVPNLPTPRPSPSLFISACRFEAPRNTAAILRSQTDWLKEFQRSIPLTSRLKLSSPPPIPPIPPSTPQLKLVLDSKNDIQLVHF